MRDTRERTFFWLGVFMLPMFWSWFTIRQEFTSRQRVAAFSWLAVTIALAVTRWEQLTQHWSFITVGYPLIIAWLTFGLAGWFCYRVGMFPRTLFEIVFLFLFFAPTAHYLLNPFYRAIGTPFNFRWLVPPLIFAILHLCVDPSKRLYRRYFGVQKEEQP